MDVNVSSVWHDLSRRNRRALRVGGTILGVGLLWSLAISPWLDAVSDRRQRLASQRQLLQAELSLLGSEPSIERSLRLGSERLQTLRTMLVPGKGAGSAAARLQQFARDNATAHRVLIAQATPRDPRPAGNDLLALDLEVAGKSDLQGISRFVAHLETAPKLLRLSHLRIRRNPAAKEASGVLAFHLTVTGYYANGDSLLPDIGLAERSAASTEGPVSDSDAQGEESS